jgi:hypothetical protein
MATEERMKKAIERFEVFYQGNKIIHAINETPKDSRTQCA